MQRPWGSTSLACWRHSKAFQWLQQRSGRWRGGMLGTGQEGQGLVGHRGDLHFEPKGGGSVEGWGQGGRDPPQVLTGAPRLVWGGSQGPERRGQDGVWRGHGVRAFPCGDLQASIAVNGLPRPSQSHPVPCRLAVGCGAKVQFWPQAFFSGERPQRGVSWLPGRPAAGWAAPPSGWPLRTWGPSVRAAGGSPGATGPVSPAAGQVARLPRPEGGWQGWVWGPRPPWDTAAGLRGEAGGGLALRAAINY